MQSESVASVLAQSLYYQSSGVNLLVCYFVKNQNKTHLYHDNVKIWLKKWFLIFEMIRQNVIYWEDS